MKNTSLDKIVQLENFIQSYGHEFQSISNVLTFYLLNVGVVVFWVGGGGGFGGGL